MLLPFSFIPVFQTDNHHGIRRTLTGNQTITSRTGIMLNLWRLIQDRLHFSDYFSRLNQRISRRGTDIDHHDTLILLWYKTRFGRRHQIDQQHGCQAQRGPGHPPMMNKEHQTLLIFAQQGIIRGVIGCPHPTIKTLRALRAIRRLHHHRAQSGTKRQSVDTRETDRHGHCHTKLRIEHTRRSTHKGHRNKHGHKDKRTGDNRHRHVAHRILRRLIRRLIANIKFCLDRLNDNDRVIDHRSDRQHQGKQGQDVDTETGNLQTSERTDQRDDDRD